MTHRIVLPFLSDWGECGECGEWVSGEGKAKATVPSTGNTNVSSCRRESWLTFFLDQKTIKMISGPSTSFPGSHTIELRTRFHDPQPHYISRLEIGEIGEMDSVHPEQFKRWRWNTWYEYVVVLHGLGTYIRYIHHPREKVDR